MIHELLGGASLIGGQRKPSLSNILDGSPSPSPSPSPSTTTAPASSSPAVENQNLRCPRCDSSNTKFCYYNNYNLTQPRHFCKTCRRYWTRGGALRNVPIGGGCRKNKSIVSVTTSANGKSGSGGGRLIKTVPSEIRKPGFGGGFDREMSSSPVMWASSAPNSHLLALLRATQNPNPMMNLVGSHLNSGSDNTTVATEALSTFWRSSNQNQSQQQQQNHHHHHHHHQQQQQQQQQIGFVLEEVQNNGFHEIYQRPRSTAHYYPAESHSSPLPFSNVAAASSSCPSMILESAPVGGGAGDQLGGYWNPTLSWSNHLPTTNGAYHNQ